jgi:hypothetical protein
MSILKNFKKGMSKFTSNIVVIVNTLLLSLVYLIGVGITSIFAKLFKKHFLELKRRNDTYWETSDLKKKPMKNYYRQF